MLKAIPSKSILNPSFKRDNGISGSPGRAVLIDDPLRVALRTSRFIVSDLTHGVRVNDAVAGGALRHARR